MLGILLSFIGCSISAAAPECTEALCCHSIVYGKCQDNTHKAPVGSADPVAFTSVEISLNQNRVTCTTGYKDKADKATIAGTTMAACCDQKTCGDLTCSSSRKNTKASPTQPTAGNNPTVANCCEDITGMCAGNTNSATDFTCGTGYKDRVNKAAIAGTTVSSCCDQLTCSDLTCSSSRKKAKASPTQPTAGNSPTVANCCEDITGMCAGNTNSANDVSCPSGFKTPLATDTYDPNADVTDAKKKAKCCRQPKCIKNVAQVTGTCEVLPVARVLGTCDLSRGYTEKTNIESLPADPTVAEWASVTLAKRVTPNSNEPDCCTPTTGRCKGNTNSGNDVTCTTGYKDKMNKADITGTTVTTCCDQRTCSDLTCSSSRRKAKASPTQPTVGNNPTVANCCEDITGMCAGNTISTNDVMCPSGMMNKAGKATLAGTTVAACCDVTPTCMSHTTLNVPFACPAGKYAKALNRVSSVAGREAKNCTNNAFDVTAITAVVGYGPVCPEPSAPTPASDGEPAVNHAFHSRQNVVWCCVLASLANIMTWCYAMM